VQVKSAGVLESSGPCADAPAHPHTHTRTHTHKHTHTQAHTHTCAHVYTGFVSNEIATDIGEDEDHAFEGRQRRRKHSQGKSEGGREWARMGGARERDASKHTNITHRQRRRQIFSGLRLCDLLSRVYGLRFTV